MENLRLIPIGCAGSNLLAALFLFGIVGCNTGSTAISGSVDGHAMLVQSCFLADYGGVGAVVISDQKDGCALANNNSERAGSTQLIMLLSNNPPGTISAVAFFQELDKQCMPALNVRGQGQVNSTGEAPTMAGQLSMVSGTFDLTFQDAASDHLTGRFDTSECGVPTIRTSNLTCAQN